MTHTLTSITSFLEFLLSDNIVSHCFEIVGVVVENTSELSLIVCFQALVCLTELIRFLEIFSYLHCCLR
jgi:hypothetical protein